jgi:integrase/recombinase XerD
MAWPRELKDHWQIRFSDADRTPQETTNSVPKAEYPTKTAADKEADRRQVLYDDPESGFDPWVDEAPGVAERSGLTILEATRRYVSEKKAAGRRGERGGWSTSSVQRRKAVLEKFARDVGPTRSIGSLRSRDIRDWTTRPSLSDATMRSYHSRLRAFVRWLAENDVADVDMPAPLQTRTTIPTYCTPTELRAICRAWPAVAIHKAAKNDNPTASATWWYADAWRFAFWQALRKSEITALRCGAIDLEAGRMRVGDKAFIPKGKDEAVIPLATPAAQIAAAWDADSRPPDERLFRHKAADYVSKAFTAARKQVFPHKEDLTLHSVRHGRCVHLLEQGLRIHVVKRYLRHSSLDSTMRYVQVVDQSLRDAIHGLGEEGLL